MTCGIAVSIVVSCKHILDHVHLACCFHMHAWAAWHNTWLLMELMPKGVGFTFWFLPFLVLSFVLFQMQAHKLAVAVLSEVVRQISYLFIMSSSSPSVPDYPSHCGCGCGYIWPITKCQVKVVACAMTSSCVDAYLIVCREAITSFDTLVPSAGKRNCTRHPLMLAHI